MHNELAGQYVIVRIDSPLSPSLPLFLAGSSAPELLHRLGNCQAIFQLPELCRRRLAQVIDFEGLQRDESVQLVEFLAVRQRFGEHDLADLLFNGHGLILSEFRLSR